MKKEQEIINSEIKSIYMLEYGEYNFEYDNGILTNLPNLPKVVKYKCEDTSSLVMNIDINRDHGTRVDKQIIDVNVNNVNLDDDNIMLISMGMPIIFIEDIDGNIFVVGGELGNAVENIKIKNYPEYKKYNLTINIFQQPNINYLDSKTIKQLTSMAILKN